MKAQHSESPKGTLAFWGEEPRNTQGLAGNCQVLTYEAGFDEHRVFFIPISPVPGVNRHDPSPGAEKGGRKDIRMKRAFVTGREPGGGARFTAEMRSGEGPKTKEDIMAVADRKTRRAMIAQNINLFNIGKENKNNG